MRRPPSSTLFPYTTLFRSLLTSALRSDCLSALSVAEATQDRSPGVIPAAFCAQSPNLRFASLMDCGLRSTLPARPTLTPYIQFLFIDSHICLTLPSDLPCGDSPCVIANPSPPSGWVEDLHLLAAEHARHTTKPPVRRTLRVRRTEQFMANG